MLVTFHRLNVYVVLFLASLATVFIQTGADCAFILLSSNCEGGIDWGNQNSQHSGLPAAAHICFIGTINPLLLSRDGSLHSNQQEEEVQRVMKVIEEQAQKVVSYQADEYFSFKVLSYLWYFLFYQNFENIFKTFIKCFCCVSSSRTAKFIEN